MSPAAVRSIALKTMFCTLIRATSISASLSWMSWNCPISRPHSLRDFAYSILRRWHSLMMPRDRDAIPMRSAAKLSLALDLPSDFPLSSVSLSRRSLVMRTLSKNSSPVGEEFMPIFLNGGLCVRPSMPLSRMKASTLRSRRSTDASPSSSFAYTIITSAYGPLVMKVLLPLRM